MGVKLAQNLPYSGNGEVDDWIKYILSNKGLALKFFCKNNRAGQRLSLII